MRNPHYGFGQTSISQPAQRDQSEIEAHLPLAIMYLFWYIII
jgi:hypothetical protein